jgi:hypothetical protein
VHALTREVERLRASLDDAIGLRQPPPPIVIAPASGRDEHEVVPLILASDWHVEEVVDPRKVQGLNEYGPKVAEQRAAVFFRNALKLIKRDARDATVRRVVVGWLGDWITGHIHQEYQATNALQPVPAMALFRGIAAAGIRYWLRNSDLEFDFVWVSGNHDRTTQKMQPSASAETSLAYIASQWLAAEFANEKRIRWHIAESDVQYLDVWPGFRLRFIHGWQLRYSDGVGGLTIPLKKWIARADKSHRANVTCLGHWHHLLWGHDHLVNSSLIGWNNYAQSFGFPFEEPSQAYAVLHGRGGGQMTGAHRIWLDAPSRPDDAEVSRSRSRG